LGALPAPQLFRSELRGEGLIPLDKWFGTSHDGGKEGQAQMEERFRRKRERLNAKADGVNGSLRDPQ
jgi:hypothetical protein